jgi:hypothetical protein
MIHKCPKCNYLTELKANMTRHCIRKHPEIITNTEIVNKPIDIVENNITNVENSEANVENFTLFNCTKCSKNYKNKRYLTTHIINCKGVKNPLECHICHKVFNTRSAKSKHISVCTSKALIAHDLNEPSSINNTINNNTLNNSGTITSNSNNTVNNITIISCKPDSNNKELIEFITKHISNPDLQKIIEPVSNGNRCSPDMVESYTRHLLTNPENRCIEKTNMRSIHSRVHVGEGKWHYKHDKDLLPYYACSVANNMDQTIKERLGTDTNLLDRRTLKAIERYLDYMSDKGYCNDADLEKDMRQEFHDIKHRLKAVIYELSND